MICTSDGIRMLKGAERRLYRGAIGMMVDWMVSEYRIECGQWIYGIDWFDQWEPGQRFFLLDEAVRALFTPEPPPSRTAVFEATVDTIRVEVESLVRLEIRDASVTNPDTSWRRDVVSAYQQQSGRKIEQDVKSDRMESWSKLIASIHDRIIGPMSYLRCEDYRDEDPEQLQAYLVQRGLPDDFLRRLPPMQSVDQTQRAIDRIQSIIFEGPES